MVSSLGSIRTVLANWNADSFDSTEFETAMKHVLAGQTPTESDQISVNAPDIAENGRTVPLEISSSMGNIESISIVIENNPRPHVSTFFIQPGMESFVSTRVKMRETSDVIALVKTDQGIFMAKKMVKVTAGGC